MISSPSPAGLRLPPAPFAHTPHPDPLRGSGLPRGQPRSHGCPGPAPPGRVLQPTPCPGQWPRGRKRRERVAALAAHSAQPPRPRGRARSARPDPCHGPPRSPSRRRPRPPHPNGRERPGEPQAPRPPAGAPPPRLAPRAAADKGRGSRRGRGLTGLPPLPGAAVRGGRPGWKSRLPAQRFQVQRRRGRVLSEHRWGLARPGGRGAYGRATAGPGVPPTPGQPRRG